MVYEHFDHYVDNSPRELKLYPEADYIVVRLHLFGKLVKVSVINKTGSIKIYSIAAGVS